MAMVYIGLGSNQSNNLGSPIDHLRQAVAALSSLGSGQAIEALQISSLYRSRPMGPQDQPDFLNAVVGMETILSANDLLTQLQTIEQQAQRIRQRRWGERSLDLDILWYADRHIQQPQLVVPHVGLLQRNFVVMPLLDINPSLHINDRPLADYPIAQDWSGLTKLADSHWWVTKTK